MAGAALRAGGGGCRGPPAPRPLPPTPDGGRDGEGGGRERGPAGGAAAAGAGRAPGRRAGPVATGVPGFSGGRRPSRGGQSGGFPVCCRPRPCRAGGRWGSGAAGLGVLSSCGAAPAEPRARPRAAVLPAAPARSAAAGAASPPPSPRFVSGPARHRPLPRARRCRGVRPGRRSASPGRTPGLRGSKGARRTEGKAGAARPARCDESDPELSPEPKQFLRRSFRREARSALAQCRGTILRQRNGLQPTHV